MTYLFRQGVRAMLYDHAGSPKAAAAYAKWEEDLIVAVRSADRQTEGFSFYPGESVMGGGGNGYGGAGIGWGANIGPAWPY
jgi:anthranilate/para-aminobenzoate synthase component II